MKLNERKKLFRERIPVYRKHPEIFCREVTHFEPDDWQFAVMKDLADFPKVSIRSGHGVGKTALEANMVLWFLACFPYARIVGTAPTAQQLNDVLWSEINKWIMKSPLLTSIMHWTKTYVYIDGYERRWFAVAKTASKPENMQGFHEDNLLFIVDEASGVEDDIMEAILATLSGGNNKLLMCANPTRMSGTFYDSHNKDRGMYKCHKVSSLDSSRTNKDNIKMFIRKYGAESNVVKVRVYGDFPEQEDDVFIQLPIIEAAINTELEEGHIDKISFGVDVARFGDDETIIVKNVGGDISIPVVRHGQDLMSTVGDIVIQYREVIKAYPKYKGVITVVIDDTGLGGGVTDRLEEVKRQERLTRLEIIPVNFGSAAPSDGAEKYADISTYMWGRVKDLLEAKQLRLANDEELIAQLSIRKYNITSNGKLALEAKKELKKRGLKSPDRGDALALSCYSTNKIYDKFIENEELVVIPISAAMSMSKAKINIGISTGATTLSTGMVATMVTEGFKKVVVLSSMNYTGAIETDAFGKEYVKFAHEIIEKYGRVDYTFVDAKSTVLIKCIKKAAQDNKIVTQVRNAANDEISNRIRLTTRLLAQNRLFLTEECESISTAFSSAIWNEKSATTVRAEGTNTSNLNAFEYTIERYATRFIAAEKGEENV